MVKKFNLILYTGTHWLPRIVWLLALWLLGSLPVLTIARSTRVTVGLIERYLWQGFETASVWQDFWLAYRRNAFAVKKMNVVFSAYFVLALGNLLLLKDVNTLVAQSIWSFCFFLLLVGSTIFLVQAFLANYRQQQVHFMEALVFAGRHSKQLLLHGFLTVLMALLLGLLGPFFLLAGSIVLFISFNLAVLLGQQKKQVQGLTKEIQGE